MGNRRKNSLSVLGRDSSLPTQLARLLAVNQRLQDELERHNTLEASWRGERGLLLAMINQVPDYLFAKDRNNLYLMANDACAQDLGLNTGVEMIGRTDLELGHDLEVVNRFIEDDQAVIRSEQPRLDIQEYMVTSTGDTKWLSTSKLPLRSESGAVIGMVGVARDVTERKRAEERIHFLAYHDTLTGLPNRLLFEQRLEQAISTAPHSETAALLYLDLDRFKIVNDTLGHPAGDELIRQVARRLSVAVRSTDTVARLGGDEFAIVMENCGPRDPEALASRIIQDLERPFELEGSIYIGVSIGIATFHGDTIEGSEMLRRADIALYRAKAHGRGRFEFFAEGMAAAVEETRKIEQELRQALADGIGIYAVYQPVFGAADGKVVGAEALIRWDHPEHGTIGPQLFISVAEERGQIEELGALILRQACTFALATDLPWVAVNVSPVQFRNMHFDRIVLSILADVGLAPDRLQIEITEGLLLESTAAVQDTIGRLRAAGVVVALDDFGTGYSSMNYLRRYDIDKLKIDRSFVEQIGISENATAIVTAIVSLARAMKMKVTAEGVETEAQSHALTAIGCEELQGYLLGRPMSQEALAELWSLQQRHASAVGATNAASTSASSCR